MVTEQAVEPVQTTTPEVQPEPQATTPEVNLDFVATDEDIKSFRESLPEGLRNDPTVAKFNSTEDFYKSYQEMRKAYSSKLEGFVKLPGEEATDEEKTAFRQALGIPNTVEDYGELTLPEGTQVDQNFFNGFKENAVKFGMSKLQVEGLLAWYNQEAGKQDKQVSEARNAKFDSIKKAHGDTLPKLVEAVKRETTSYNKELRNGLNEEENKNNPVIFQLINHYMGKNKQDVVPTNITSGTQFLSAEQANLKAKEIRTKMDEVDRGGEEYKKLDKELDSMYDIINSQKG